MSRRTKLIISLWPRPCANVAAVLYEAPASRSPDDTLTRDLRGFGVLGIFTFVVIAAIGPVFEPLAGILVLAWVAASQTPWRAIGYVRPKNWGRTTIVGILLGCALKFFLKAIVMPLLGADPINPAYHYLVGNTGALLGLTLYMLVAAGFNEETVFRGFAFERLGKLLGTGVRAKTAIVLLTSAWFALVHYPEQGRLGVEQAAITGLVFGTIFAATGRIWIVMVAHAVFDLTAAAIIFLNLESTIAHLAFK